MYVIMCPCDNSKINGSVTSVTVGMHTQKGKLTNIHCIFGARKQNMTEVQKCVTFHFLYIHIARICLNSKLNPK